MEEDYVSFETAKLLKEKGFNWNTDKQYNLDKIVGDYNITDRSRYPERYLDAPTIQMAMKWLRKAHKLCITIIPKVTDDDGSGGCLWEWVATYLLVPQSISLELFESYEEACEAAIKYCLENLLKK